MRTADRYLAVLSAALLAELVILAEATDTVRASWPWIAGTLCAGFLLLAGIALVVGVAGTAWRKHGRRTVPSTQMRRKVYVSPARYAKRPTRLDIARAAVYVEPPQRVEPSPAEWASLLAAAAADEAEQVAA